MTARYESADAWKRAAMLREVSIDEGEVRLRREQARLFYVQQETLPAPEVLADHELYITGRMELAEYQDYLVFKYGRGQGV